VRFVVVVLTRTKKGSESWENFQKLYEIGEQWIESTSNFFVLKILKELKQKNCVTSFLVVVSVQVE
jgi:hypothetical protein